MSEEYDWVRVALGDDNLVADILLNFNRQQTVPPPPPQKLAALPLEWSVRQRRSSSVINNNNNNAPKLLGKTKKASEPARASPTTPLSWSSVADGFEEISCLSVVRSKVAVGIETTTTKRPRKKKTLAELKEEESSLLEERVALKSRLEALKLLVVEQRVKNESLKRLKIDLLSRNTPEVVKSEKVHPGQTQVECDPTCSISSISAATNKLLQSLPNCSSQAEEIQRNCSFLLPDLNVPIEEDSGSNILYGTS